MLTDKYFSELVDGTDITSVEAVTVPSPPGSHPQGDHLFVNCGYGLAVNSMDPDYVLRQAIHVTAVLLRLVVKHELAQGTTSVCISILGRASGGGHRRIFRYSVLTSALAQYPEAIDEESLIGRDGSIQSSEIDSIAARIHQMS